MPNRREVLGATLTGVLGFVVTHIDVLCHIFTPEEKQGMYNGFPISAATPQGAAKLGVEVLGETDIVGLGVLLDIAELKGEPLNPGSAIMPADLAAAEARQGVTVGEGDQPGLRRGAALGVLRQRGALALQGRHQLAGQPAGDVLMPGQS